jgi:hypothetical protein
MPSHVFWDNDEKTVIRNEAEGRWTWEEYHEGVDRIVTMMHSIPYRVDLITVSMPNAVMPKGSVVPHFQRALRLLPANTGLLIVVNKDPISRGLAKFFTSLPGSSKQRKSIFAAHLEEARALIAKDRAKQSNAANSYSKTLLPSHLR